MTPAASSSPAAGHARRGPGPLWELLANAERLDLAWRASRHDADRLAMLAAWSIHITCTGARLGGGTPRPGEWSICTPTVLCRHSDDPGSHLAYRGACLGCGWVSAAEHGLSQRGENGAAEDANDHTHPGWRDLPVLPALPVADGVAGRRALAAWRQRHEPSLPAGWLDAGGPIRTRRAHPVVTRHVPGRCPGGGYDMAATGAYADARVEGLGGQLVLDLR